MNSNRALQSCESAFYASLAGKSETGDWGSCGGGLSRIRATHSRARFGFVRCRNALIYKPSGESEASEGTEELPAVNVPGGGGMRPAKPARGAAAHHTASGRKNVAVVRRPRLPSCAGIKTHLRLRSPMESSLNWLYS